MLLLPAPQAYRDPSVLLLLALLLPVPLLPVPLPRRLAAPLLPVPLPRRLLPRRLPVSLLLALLLLLPAAERRAELRNSGKRLKKGLALPRLGSICAEHELVSLSDINPRTSTQRARGFHVDRLGQAGL